MITITNYLVLLITVAHPKNYTPPGGVHQNNNLKMLAFFPKTIVYETLRAKGEVNLTLRCDWYEAAPCKMVGYKMLAEREEYLADSNARRLDYTGLYQLSQIKREPPRSQRTCNQGLV